MIEKGGKLVPQKLVNRGEQENTRKVLARFYQIGYYLEFCKYSILKISKQNVKDLIKKRCPHLKGESFQR